MQRAAVFREDATPRTAAPEKLPNRYMGRMPREKAIEEEPDNIVVPVIVEELAVKTHRVERGRVQIHKRVEAHEEIVQIPTVCEQVHVERIPINKLLDDVAPEVHEENGVLIIPLVEEVLTPENRLMLREEVRISKRRFETVTCRKVVLRREVVEIVRQ